MRGVGLLGAGAFVALLAYGVLAQAPNRSIDEALLRSEAAAAPGFDLTVLERGDPGGLGQPWDAAARDGRVALGELRGTPIVLNFWASWCVPCREEAPVLERGWRRARERGVLFLGLNMQDVREDARAFIRELGLDFPHVRDPSKDTARAWGVTGIPETFFIGRDGQVVGHVIGTVSAEQLAAGVAAASAGRPRGTQRGGAQLRPR
ncbi:MAG: TlpA family protein disulfide reductase [Solirubrobacteraceae bacterium]